MRSIWTSYQKLLLLSRISRNKESEKERCTFRGVFGKKLSIITGEQENFAYVRLMFSTICKNNSSMHNELKNPSKIHEIADIP